MWDEMHVRLNIHMDPIDTKNKQLAALKERVDNVIAKLEPDLSIHDFRMVNGDTHVNLVFDVVVPYDSKITLNDIHSACEKEFENDETKYYFVIDMDRKMA